MQVLSLEMWIILLLFDLLVNIQLFIITRNKSGSTTIILNYGIQFCNWNAYPNAISLFGIT